MKNPKTQPKFEDCSDTIDVEIAKRRHKWNLTSISWMDYDDVSQIIRIHINNKWDQYKPSRPLAPWLNTLITNQIRNLIRNHYSNFSRPCLKCAAAIDGTGCAIYQTQCAACPLYAYWQKRKQPATFVKMPVSIENHANEVRNISDNSSNTEEQINNVHQKMKEILKPIEWQVYEGLFINDKSESELAREMCFISNEKGRPPGYKQIKNIRKSIIAKAKLAFQKGDIDVV